MQITLTNRVAVVTGGSSGIGAGIAEALAKAGAAVVINYHSDEDGAQEVVDQITTAGGRALAIKADVGREADADALIMHAVESFGRLDILVANAGIQADAAFVDMSLDDWQKVIATNLTGQFLVARSAVRRFMAQEPATEVRSRGAIICMSSVHQHIPWAGHVNYAASKGGIKLLMESLALEVAEHKIRVNGVAPGAIATPINQEVWSDPEARKKLLKLIPYGRIGETDDVAAAVVWLASDAADYITGTTLVIDGGMSLYPGFKDNG